MGVEGAGDGGDERTLKLETSLYKDCKRERENTQTRKPYCTRIVRDTERESLNSKTLILKDSQH